jgi:hypothetical protein
MSKKLDGKDGEKECGLLCQRMAAVFWSFGSLGCGMGSAYSIDRPVLRPGIGTSDLYIINNVYSYVAFEWVIMTQKR